MHVLSDSQISKTYPFSYYVRILRYDVENVLKYKQSTVTLLFRITLPDSSTKLT